MNAKDKEIWFHKTVADAALSVAARLIAAKTGQSVQRERVVLVKQIARSIEKTIAKRDGLAAWQPPPEAH